MRDPFLPPSLLARPIDVCGIENAILDLLLLTDDATVTSLGLHKGTMRLVETEEQARILEAVSGLDPEVEAGGSCANVLRVASLAGAVTSYSSAVGHDAERRAPSSRRWRAAPCATTSRASTGRTGTSVILVTPDGERTMNTHLGVCRQYRPEFVPIEEIRASKIFFTTGYIFDTPNQIQAIETAFDAARGAGVRIALDLADRFVMERSRGHLERQFELGIDLLFANARGVAGADRARSAAGRSRALDAGEDRLGHRRRQRRLHRSRGRGRARAGAPGRRWSTPPAPGDCFNAGFLRGLVGGLAALRLRRARDAAGGRDHHPPRREAGRPGDRGRARDELRGVGPEPRPISGATALRRNAA